MATLLVDVTDRKDVALRHAGHGLLFRAEEALFVEPLLGSIELLACIPQLYTRVPSSAMVSSLLVKKQFSFTSSSKLTVSPFLLDSPVIAPARPPPAWALHA